MDNREIEVRFLEIDVNKLKRRLKQVEAKDVGDDLLDEAIFYDKDMQWTKDRKVIRIRRTKNGIFITYKHHDKISVDGSEEIEIKVNDFEKAQALISKTGLVLFRHQQKRRHTFIYKNVTIDIDTWPKVPTYVELEGESEKDLKNAAKALDLDWKNVYLKDARYIIEQHGIPVLTLKYYTFDKIE